MSCFIGLAFSVSASSCFCRTKVGRLDNGVYKKWSVIPHTEFVQRRKSTSPLHRRLVPDVTSRDRDVELGSLFCAALFRLHRTCFLLSYTIKYLYPFTSSEMGFCRRCGDIVPGERCHCGGASVGMLYCWFMLLKPISHPAPVVSWKSSSSPMTNQDRWSKTYVSSISPAPERTPRSSAGAVASALNSLPITNSNTSKRFPRPPSSSSAPVRQLKAGVSDHINAATSSGIRPPSPLKISTTLSDAENDILPSFLPNEPTLSKVYGSLLQPTETLPLHSCARCSAIFPPDATIYPDPSQPNTGSFLCKNCFTISGGSKGTCPACSRPVLVLKSEGGFVQSGGQYWHKRCYNCAGCFKNIGDAPMVDLLGRPSCVECFDNCLKGPTTPKKSRTSNNNSPNVSNPGGLNPNFGKKSRESSPAIEELEQRLGLVKSHQGSPVHLDTSRNLSARSDMSSSRVSSSDISPLYNIRDVFSESLSISSVKKQPVSPTLGQLSVLFYIYISVAGCWLSE